MLWRPVLIAAISLALSGVYSEVVLSGAGLSVKSEADDVSFPAEAVEKPAKKEPAVMKPAKEEPAVEKPAKEEPAVEKPAKEEPATPAKEDTSPAAADAHKESPEEKYWYYGYLWIIVIIYMFYAQEHVCEAYFVAAIDVFVADQKRKGSPLGEEAVAGATICALGCNGPELFTNLIACCLLGGSDVGVGTIVGSEVFNLLVILGGAVVSAPVLPVHIDKVPFTRDVFFYALSIILLALVLKDGIVTVAEACGLFSCAIIYTLSVFFTSTLVKKVVGEPLAAQVEESDEQGGKMHGITVKVEEVIKNRMADAKNQEGATDWLMDPTPAGLFAEPRENAFARRQTMDGDVANKRGSVGFQFDGNQGPILPYKYLKEIVTKEQGIIELNFEMSIFETTVLRLTVPDPADNKKFLQALKDNQSGKAWVHEYNPFPTGILEHFCHTMKAKNVGCVSKIMELLCFPIELALATTLCLVDVKYVRYKNRWLGCFCGSMAWLAVFSYIMCSAADAIHRYFGVPTAVLGITLCAVGTSFPNAVASILMSKQNKPGLAIANALGSNVQNIFLAMALPWVIVTVFPIKLPGREPEWFSEFPMPSPGIMEGVAWMLGTLVLALGIILLGGCKLGRGAGYILCSTYVIYLAVAILECVGVNVWGPFKGLMR